MHVLIVTRGYPPLDHVSRKRPYYFARALASRGTAVTVICLDWRSGATLDDQEKDSVPADDDSRANVVRVQASKEDRVHPAEDSATHVGKLARKLQTAFRLAYWGPYPGWGKAALASMLHLHRRHPATVVWSIHGDATSHEVAHRFHQQTGVPWVADFKDRWDGYVGGGLARQVNSHATHRRLRTASMLTETAAAQCQLDEQTFRLKGHVVMSGYDSDLMARAAPRAQRDGFRIAYFGTINRNHDFGLLTRGLGRASALDPQLASRLRLELFSSSAVSLLEAMRRDAPNVMASVEKQLSEEDAFVAMRSVDLLVLFPANSTQVGVKEIEYFATGTPVLSVGLLRPEIRSIVPEGAPLIEALDENQIADRILGQMKGSGGVSRGEVNPNFVSSYTWQQQGLVLERVLQSASVLPDGSFPGQA